MVFDTVETTCHAVWMREEEINRAIAEEMGWKWTFDGNEEDPVWFWIPPNDPDGNGKPPNFFADLNACRQMVIDGLTTGEERELYVSYLFKIRGGDLMYPQPKDAQRLWLVVSAAAPECCEAFLHVKGKYTDGPVSPPT